MTPLTVVAIDDEVMILDVMKTILEAHGMKVYSFSSASDAIAHIKQHSASIDAVITDYKMPGDINGGDIYNFIKSNYPLIVCFISTGYIDVAVSGIDEQFIVTKPINFNRFIPALYRAYEEHRL